MNLTSDVSYVSIDKINQNDGLQMKTILIVDDALEVREMLNDFLTMQKFGTLQAENGVEAMKIVGKSHPDLAIVDIEMPQMNGLEFARWASDAFPEIPIIIISAYLEKSSLEFIKNLGVKKVLRKPLDLRQLKEEIDALIDDQ
jgi:CheY-like chemotaxis protein